MKVDIFVDDEGQPRVSFEPPGEFELDTGGLEDGAHVLHIRAAGGEEPAGTALCAPHLADAAHQVVERSRLGTPGMVRDPGYVPVTAG